MNALGMLLWVILPYICLTMLVVGMVWRWRADKFGWTTRSSQLHDRKLLRLGSPLMVLCMVAWTALTLALVLAAGPLLVPLAVGVFVVAWVFQFIGHKIEGKKPSFFEDIQYLWVGPLFVLSKLLARLGLRW